MTVTLSKARYREEGGRDSLARASVQQGNAGAIFGLNCVYAACGATTATTTSKVKTVNSTQFTVGGQIFTKAATDNFWTLGSTTSATVVAASSFQKYLLCVDDAGVATVVEGTQSLISAASVGWQNIPLIGNAGFGMAVTAPKDPWAAIVAVLNASRCIFAVLTVATNSSTTFTPGTTLLGSSRYYVNVSGWD
jgi:hypothetical protein